MPQAEKTMESDPSLNGLCLNKTENMNAHSDHKVNVDFIFPSFPHRLLIGLQDGTVGTEEHETRVAGHFPATWAAMLLDVNTLKKQHRNVDITTTD